MYGKNSTCMVFKFRIGKKYTVYGRKSLQFFLQNAGVKQLRTSVLFMYSSPLLSREKWNRSFLTESIILL